MKMFQAYPVLSTWPDGYHFESPAVTGNRFCWSQIHRTPEAKSPGAVHWFEIPKEGFSEDGLELDVRTLWFDEPVPAIVPTDTPGTVLVAKERSFHVLNLDDPSAAERVSDLPAYGGVVDAHPEVRLNDCQAGFDGRLYAGTMAYDCVAPLGKWGPFTPDGGWAPMIEEVKISNGFDWTEPSADGSRRLVYIDSKSGNVDTLDESSEIWRFRHDPSSGSLGPREVLTNLTPHAERQLDGCPVVADGGKMAFDKTGKAFFVNVEYNGAAGHLTDVETGEVVARIDIPALKPTSCCWVGDALVITTTKEGLQEVDVDSLSEDQQRKVDFSGNLFWCRPDGFQGREPFNVVLST